MQRLSRFSIVCLILNRAIGSGIFIQPVNVLFQSDSSGVAILMWVIAGLIMCTIMLCWLELGLTIPLYHIPGVSGLKQVSAPRSGGDKNYVGYDLSSSQNVMAS